jgi:hypothetical protein
MNTLFNGNQGDDIDIDPNQDPLEVLTGPGGKYDKTKYTSELEMYKALARGKLEADVTIMANNRRMDELRGDFLALKESRDEGASVKAMLDQFKAEMLNNTNRNSTDDDQGNKPVYDPNEVKSLMSQTILEHEKTQRENANFNKVDQKLRETFGGNYANALKKEIDALGLTVAEADALAKRSPEAFFRTFGLNQQQTQSFDAPMRSSDRRSDTFSPQVVKRDNAYYQKLKKENKALYYEPKTQNQMIKDIEALGADFGKII